MTFTIDAENDQKTCDGCGTVMPLSSGHVCAHLIHAHVRESRGLNHPAPAEPKHEFDKTEWRSVYFHFKPSATEEEYDADWAEFQAMKAEHERKKHIQ